MGIIHIYSIHGSHGYYLSAYARQPARGPTMWPILWLCWPMLIYLAGNVGPSCGYVGLCWPQVDSCWAKRSEKWEQQKNTVKRTIFWWSAAYLGAMLAHLGAMLAYLEGNVGLSWGYVGPSWGHVGPSWSYDGPSWGYLDPSWGYVGPSWGLCWLILRAMLAHVDPSWATRSEKWEKMGRAQNTVKRDSFWRYRLSIGRGGGPSLLRRGENCRTAMPGRIKGCRPCRRPRNKQPRLADLLGVSHHFEWAIFRFSNNLTCLPSVIIYLENCRSKQPLLLLLLLTEE